MQNKPRSQRPLVSCILEVQRNIKKEKQLRPPLLLQALPWPLSPQLPVQLPVSVLVLRVSVHPPWALLVWALQASLVSLLEDPSHPWHLPGTLYSGKHVEKYVAPAKNSNKITVTY